MPGRSRWWTAAREADFRTCGEPVLLGKSYCADHHAKAYVGRPKRKARPEPVYPAPGLNFV